jgi:L-aspartate oxidase
LRPRDVLLIDDGDGSTRWAQDGIAVALRDDDPNAHARDTERAGAHHGEPAAVRRLVEEGPQRVAELIARGARLDTDVRGRLLRSREGGHDRPRVVHAGGDSTGAEVWRALHSYSDGSTIRRMRGTQVNGLVLTGGVPASSVTVSGAGACTGACTGAVTGVVAQGPDGPITIRASAVVLATGGVGHVYGATTNPVAVRSQGIALALLAGASVTGLEFVQFHPTALATGERSGQLPLVTEALRGAGAVLRGRAGTPFMAGLHPMANLAPRDVVAAAVHRTMRTEDTEHVWLDCREVAGVHRRFPTVTAACAEIGVDPARDLVPVRPAEHFLCGGIATDAWGATTVPGLYAVGEVADAGVHGANQLASNSLLEGLVYGARVAATLTLELPTLPSGPTTTTTTTTTTTLSTDPILARTAQQIMATHAGIERTTHGLALAHTWLAAHASQDATCLVGAAIVEAAALRVKSVGCHRRTASPMVVTR